MSKKNVVKFIYTDLTNELHVEYHELATVILTHHISELSGIENLIIEYTNAYATEVSLLDIVRKSEITSQIILQDSVRDRKYHALCTAVKQAILDEKEGAANVEMVIDSYGNIVKKSYDAETAAIDDIIRELREHRAVEILQLNLQNRINALETENNNFKNLMNSRYAKMAELPDIRMVNARKIVDKLYRSILNYIEVISIIPGNEYVLTICKELNVVSERYRRQISQKKGKIAAAKKNSEQE
jgi:ribosomal silencing factor RsfS